MPMYGAKVNGIKVTPSNSISPHSFRIFREDNIIPLSTLEGYHIHYTHVEEILSGGSQGRIKYTFEKEDTPLSNNFPIEPGDLAVKRGKLKLSQVESSIGTALQSTEIDPIDPTYLSSRTFIKPFVAHT